MIYYEDESGRFVWALCLSLCLVGEAFAVEEDGGRREGNTCPVLGEK